MTTRKLKDKQQYAQYVSPGMPALGVDGKILSFFEFWPSWLMYFPVLVQSLFLSLRYGSITVPLLSNPKLPLSGMVGIAKSTLMAQAVGECKKAILPWFTHQVKSKDIEKEEEQLLKIEQRMSSMNLYYPVVCKPEIGCRGTGVKLINKRDILLNYIASFPVGECFQIQKVAQWEAEAGVFYVREPDQDEGKIVSLAFKYTPYLLGDGVQTLHELIHSDARANLKAELYLERHKKVLDTIIPKNEPFKLIFAASHSKGAIFRNAQDFITPALTQKINSLMKELPDFYYGRLDIKFSSTEQLLLGQDIEIVEINAASSESLHIWDRKTSLLSAMKALLWQYRTLYRLGHKNKRRGYSAPGLKKLLKAWKKEYTLSKLYPQAD